MKLKDSVFYILIAIGIFVFSFFAHKFHPINTNDAFATVIGLFYIVLAKISRVEENQEKQNNG